MPGDKPFKTKELSKQIGSARLSFATPDFMLEFLDIKPGAVSVMGLMNDKDSVNLVASLHCVSVSVVGSLIFNSKAVEKVIYSDFTVFSAC